MSLYWHKSDGSYQMVDEVLEYRPSNMVLVLSAGAQLYLRQESLVVL